MFTLSLIMKKNNIIENTVTWEEYKNRKNNKPTL